MAVFRARDKGGNIYDLPFVKGEPGYTPVKGVDYFTEEEKAEFTKAVTDHASSTDNPHSVTAEQVGLGNVDNTSDKDKPVSNAQAAAIADAKKAGTEAMSEAKIAQELANNAQAAADTAQGRANSAHTIASMARATASTKLSKDGSDAMTGDLYMDNHIVTDLGVPTRKTDAANKEYVDRRLVKLWENEDNTKDFAERTFILNSAEHSMDEYVGVSIYFKAIKSGAGYYMSELIPLGRSAYIHCHALSGDIRSRLVSVSETGVTFGSGYRMDSKDNACAIPVAIYGWKGVLYDYGYEDGEEGGGNGGDAQ